MPAYTTSTLVEAMLPSSLPASITAAHKARWISDASAMVDGLVGPRYPMGGTGKKFADAPDTPAWIELCARWLAGYFGFVQLREINKSDKLPSQGQKYFDQATKYLEQIRDGKLDIYDASGAVLASQSDAWSSTETRDKTFSRGERVAGVLQGDPGTLDEFSL